MEKDHVSLLLIEDNPIIQKAHRKRLVNSGYQVTLVTSGEEAQAFLLPGFPGGASDFRLVVLDLGLPDIDGVDLCRWIRSYYSSDVLPIIVVTAFGEEKREAALAAGAQLYLTKPIKLGGFSILQAYS